MGKRGGVPESHWTAPHNLMIRVFHPTASQPRHPVPARCATSRYHFLFYRASFRIEECDRSHCKGGRAHMLSRETDADSYKHTKLDYHATVREMPSHERPRERLQH